MEATTRKLIRDYGGTVLGAVVVALLIRFFIIEAYRIPTTAMRPTLEPGDTVFVAKAPLGTRIFGGDKLKRGDVILFRPLNSGGRDYIKRIIGLPGDIVEISQGKLKINGKALDLQIAPNASCGIETLPEGKSNSVCYEPPPAEDYGPEKVPAGSLFVLGDFRNKAQTEFTSRETSWGLIPQEAFRGRALWIWLSLEPPVPSEGGGSSGRFPKLRFERMFRRIQ